MDPHNDQALVSKEAEEYWGPVDWYNGGMEHTTLHLLYSRFWHKFLYDIGAVHTSEPYAKRTSHGMILGLNPHNFDNLPEEERRALLDECGGEEQAREALAARYGEMANHPIVKMSKSLGNVVNPDDVVRDYGADTMRVYIMFLGDFEKAAPWQATAVRGCERFLDRVWTLAQSAGDSDALTPANEAMLHRTIRKVTDDIDSLKMNTAIAAMMTAVNELASNGCSRGDMKIFLQLLNPFAPHVTEELWEALGIAEKEGCMCCQSTWPVYDESKTIESSIEMAIQVNGKMKGTMTVPMDCDESTAVETAMTIEKIQRATAGMQVVKTILVKNRLVNLIVRPQ